MLTYLARNTVNGKFYIGSTNNFLSRKNQHLNTKFRSPFHNALRKNPEVFDWEVYEDDSEERELEQALLDMFFGTEMCYNLSPNASGFRGSQFSPKGYVWRNNGTEEKIVHPSVELDPGWDQGRLPIKEGTRPKCATATGRVWITNGARSEEKYLKAGEKIPAGWSRGRKIRPPRSQEVRDKIRASKTGKSMSEEAKKNMRKAALLREAMKRQERLGIQGKTKQD